MDMTEVQSLLGQNVKTHDGHSGILIDVFVDELGNEIAHLKEYYDKTEDAKFYGNKTWHGNKIWSCPIKDIEIDN